MYPSIMISLQVGQLEMMEKEATPEKPKQMGNKEKMRRKEENWEVGTITMFMITTTMFAIEFITIPTICQVSLSDDSWYKAPQFRPEVFYLQWIRFSNL